MCAAIALIALRLAVGFHFFKEGVGKLQDPKPYSGMFFSGAKGPLAPIFHGLVWDADGHARFDADTTIAAWSRFVEQAKGHYRFDADQVTKADQQLARREEQLKAYLGGLADDLDEYRKGLDRRAANQASAARMEVPSLRGQTDKTESELKSKRGAWLAELDRMSLDVQRDMFALATPEQRAASGELAVRKPGRRWLDSEAIDGFIPYFDLTIGVLLILGLFTRTAASLGGAFLASVVASQWPGSWGAQPVYYQSVEMLALFVLAAVNAGRVGGLDSLIVAARAMCCPPKTSTAKTSAAKT